VFNTFADNPAPIPVNQVQPNHSLYPNPVTDVLSFYSSKFSGNNQLTISVVDIQGRVIRFLNEQQVPVNINCKSLNS
jgi:hypothetical protein